eukprot:1085411-Prymnesium_polylepis.2
MWLISPKDLLELSSLRPHQQLLQEGRLVEYNEQLHRGRVIFVSHQWLGYSEPDPDGQQLRALQTALRRLGAGQTIETNWMAYLAFRTNTHVKANELRAALPHMMLWIDYVSMPQNLEGNGIGQKEAGLNAISGWRC